MRKVLIGAAALLLSGSLAAAGEGLGLKVEVGLDLGVVQNAESEMDGGPAAKYSATTFVPWVEVTKGFGAAWSAAVRIRGVLGLDDDGGEFLEEDAESSFDSFDVRGLAGYTFKLGEAAAVTPVLGLSYRNWSSDAEMDDFSVEGGFDAELLVVDFGARAEVKLGDKFGIAGSVMLGLPLTGSNQGKTNGPWGDDEADLDGGFLLEVRAAVEYRLTDMVALTGGLAYETLSVDWQWDDWNTDGTDEQSRFAVQLGAALRF